MIFSLADLARRPFGSGGGAVRSLIVACFFLSCFLASPVCELLRESKPEAYVVVPESRVAVVAVRNPTVSRVAAPTAAT